MNQHVCSLTLLINQPIGLIKVFREVEGVVIDCGNVQVLDIRWHRRGKIFAFGGRDHCPDSKFYMKKTVLSKVFGFEAA